MLMQSIRVDFEQRILCLFGLAFIQLSYRGTLFHGQNLKAFNSRLMSGTLTLMVSLGDFILGSFGDYCQGRGWLTH
jgi:hypothetical protein